MAFLPFQTTANGSFDSQPLQAGEPVVLVSSDADDDGLSVTVNGELSSASVSEAVVLTSNGRIERESTSDFDALTSVVQGSAITGTVSIYGQGEKGSGDLTFASIPTEGLELVVGLVGYEQTYTYRTPGRVTIVCPAGGTLVTTAVPASYVKVVLDATAHYFWFSNGTSVDPAPGGTGHSVAFTGADANTLIATNLLASMASNIPSFFGSLSTATITLTGIALGLTTVTQDGGNDFTITHVATGTAAAANQIRTGYDIDGTTATTTDVALWTAYALNDSDQGKITCPAGSVLNYSAIAASYVSVEINSVVKYFWFSGGGTTDPAPGGTGYAVTFVDTDTATVVATALQASMVTNLTSFDVSRVGTIITIASTISGPIVLTQDGGSFTMTLPIVAGNQFSAATAANAYAKGSASGAVTTLTDRVSTYRSLGWTVTAPTGATARTIIGGAYGVLLAQLTGSSPIQTAQSFDNADLADNTLLALWASTTDAISVGGRNSTLRLAINNVTSTITAKIQASDDGTTWYDITGTTALTGTVAGTAAAYVLTGTSTLFTTELQVGSKITISGYTYTVASIGSATSLYTAEPLATSPSGTAVVKLNPVQISLLDNNSQFVAMPPVEYARLNITANANTTGSKLHAGLIL